MDSQVIDLGDFIPRTFTLKFSINGHPYAFEYGEATVDEVLRLLAEKPDETSDPREKIQRVVTEFLCKRTEQREQLAQDIGSLRYNAPEAPIDIWRLYLAIQQKYPKKGRGVEEAPSSPGRSGWCGRLLGLCGSVMGLSRIRKSST